MNGSDGARTPVDVVPVDPHGEAAERMCAALWAEIQLRYGFSAPNPFDPDGPAARPGGFWVAFDEGKPVGSIALTGLEDGRAELDAMYVVPTHRRRGVANALLAALEAHARAVGVTSIVLRAGDPQPEALAFYRRAGFSPSERFGRWTHDDTAICLQKTLG